MSDGEQGLPIRTPGQGGRPGPIAVGVERRDGQEGGGAFLAIDIHQTDAIRLGICQAGAIGRPGEHGTPPTIDAAGVGAEDLKGPADLTILEGEQVDIVIRLPAGGGGTRLHGGIGDLVSFIRLPISEVDHVGNAQVDRGQQAGGADDPEGIDLFIGRLGGFAGEEQPLSIGRKRENVAVIQALPPVSQASLPGMERGAKGDCTPIITISGMASSNVVWETTDWPVSTPFSKT